MLGGVQGDDLDSMMDEPFTMFHPTPRAIKNFLIYWKSQGKPLSRTYLRSIFKYHFLNTTIFSGDIPEGDNFLPTLMTESRYVNLGENESQIVNVRRRKGARCECRGPGCNCAAVTVNFGVPGWRQNTASVVKADIPCHKGVVHIVDKVLWFPRYASQTLTEGWAGAMLAALSSSGQQALVDTTSNVTVFVPTNNALEAALGGGPPDAAALKDIIETHVAKGSLFASDILSKDSLDMYNGKTVSIEKSNGDVFVGGAKVILPNVILRNGVMHVLDKVLAPKSMEATL